MKGLWVCVLVLTLGAGFTSAQTSPRRPRGIYAVVDIDTSAEDQQSSNPSITTAELHTYFINYYNQLLANPATSGLAIQVGWARLNPDSPATSSTPYDWSWLDDAFSTTTAWNSQNPTAPPKTIQVSLFPGYFTPSWLLNQIPSCDGLFQSPPVTPPSNCGEATFAGFGEPHDNLSVLPMPWNPLYQSSYQTFLIAFAARYGSNPLFVSMDVGGPTAASTEMIVPNDNNTPAQFNGTIQPGAMWQQLLQFAYPNQPAYWESDQAFIDAWDDAIDVFGQTFSGLTLMAWTGDGLLNLSGTGFSVPAAFKSDCPVVNMDCAAETTILSYFVESSVGGNNAKSTGEAGNNGVIPPSAGFNLGESSAKNLSLATVQFTSPAQQILGGQQFGTSFSRDPAGEGCTVPLDNALVNPPAGCTVPSGCTTLDCLPAVCIPLVCLAPGLTQADVASYPLIIDIPAKDVISPEQAAYNVLRNYFNDTSAASSFGGTPGDKPENFLQIYGADFQYAANHVNNPAQVIQTDDTTISITAQQLLNLASQNLLAISEDGPALLSIALGHAGTFSAGQQGATYTVTVANPTLAWFVPTSAVTVTETLPSGLTLSSMSGAGWSCSSNLCTRSDALEPGAAYPAITVTVNVAANAPSQVANAVTVSGGGAPTAGATDTDNLATGCSLAIAPSPASLPSTGTSTVESCPGSSQPDCGVLPEIPQSFTVTPGAACGAWTATSSNPEFLQLTSGAGGSGSGTVSYALLTNTHNGAQSYSITVASGAASATYSISEAGNPDSEAYRQVYALYEQLLGRDPDAGGFAFWSGTGGAGLGQMADDFLISPESFNSDFAVMAAYQAATGGPPAFAQYTAAVASLRTGTQTVAGLFNSLTGVGYGASNLYRNLLGRAPGSADSSCYAASLSQCFQTIIGYPSSTTPVGAANQEFQNTGAYSTAPDHSNALYVQLVYYVTLSRDPDPNGFSFWLGVANSGGPGLLFQGSAGYPTRIQILGPGTAGQGFIGSPEFQALFAN